MSTDVKIPTATSIKTNIMEFYLADQEKIQKILQEIESQILFTLDIWTSVSMKAFLAITAHYIDKSWKMQSITIDFVQLWGIHSGENIKEAFLLCLKKFMIQTKVNLSIY